MSSQQPESNSAPAAAAAASTSDAQSSASGQGIGKLIRRLTTKKDGRKRFSNLFAKPGQTSAVAEEEGAEAKGDDDKEGAAQSRFEDLEGVTQVSKLEIHTKRAHQLGARFGLDFDLSQWQSTEGTVLRVEKPIRMRVRRSCHVCNATFGKDRECPECQHPRCTKCIRHPPRRPEAERSATRERVQDRLREHRNFRPGCGYIVPDPCPPKKLPPLTRHVKCPNQDTLVYKKPRQRIRRTCHICNSLFHGSNKECETCCHIRCTDCPRDPPKKDKYPYGYPGDAWGPTAIPHHKCHACKTLFPGGASDGTPCGECGHRKCAQCLRMKPHKVEQPADPEILDRIAESFARLDIEKTERAAAISAAE